MKKILIATLLTCAAGLAFADGTLQPKYGGTMVEAKSGNRIELVVSPGMVMVYLTDHSDKPLDTRGASGEITLLSGTSKTTAKLQAGQGNALMAHGTFNVAAGAKSIVKFALAGKPAEQVRLEIK